MPINIAQSILSQMAMAGKPRTITETTTAKEPLDLASLGMLLYFILQGEKGNIPLTEQIAPPAPMMGFQGLPTGIPTGQINPSDLLKMILGG